MNCSSISNRQKNLLFFLFLCELLNAALHFRNTSSGKGSEPFAEAKLNDKDPVDVAGQEGNQIISRSGSKQSLAL